MALPSSTICGLAAGARSFKLHEKGRPAVGQPSRLRGAAQQRPGVVRVLAARDLAPERVSVGKELGSGSFGVVYEGSLRGDDGTDTPIVLKKAKSNADAREMLLMEARMNERMPLGCGPAYLGNLEVSGEAASRKLAAGHWLLWRYEGRDTLAAFLRQRDFPAALTPRLLGDAAADDLALCAPPAAALAVAQRVMSQLFEALKGLHGAGLVHRDVKPLNLLLADEAPGKRPRFKLIDLGACACLRTGANYSPHTTILDPRWAAPEQYLFPRAAAPELGGPLAAAQGLGAWLRHSPDLFDSYACGLILLQLTVPQLRSDGAIDTLAKALAAAGHDLGAWRDRKAGSLRPTQTAVLDAGGGAGWELARSLLLPHGDMSDAALGKRISPAEALRFRFFDLKAEKLWPPPGGRVGSQEMGPATAAASPPPPPPDRDSRPDVASDGPSSAWSPPSATLSAKQELRSKREAERSAAQAAKEEARATLRAAERERLFGTASRARPMTFESLRASNSVVVRTGRESGTRGAVDAKGWRFFGLGGDDAGERPNDKKDKTKEKEKEKEKENKAAKTDSGGFVSFLGDLVTSVTAERGGTVAPPPSGGDAVAGRAATQLAELQQFAVAQRARLESESRAAEDALRRDLAAVDDTRSEFLRLAAALEAAAAAEGATAATARETLKQQVAKYEAVAAAADGRQKAKVAEAAEAARAAAATDAKRADVVARAAAARGDRERAAATELASAMESMEAKLAALRQAVQQHAVPPTTGRQPPPTAAESAPGRGSRTDTEAPAAPAVPDDGAGVTGVAPPPAPVPVVDVSKEKRRPKSTSIGQALFNFFD